MNEDIDQKHTFLICWSEGGKGGKHEMIFLVIDVIIIVMDRNWYEEYDSHFPYRYAVLFMSEAQSEYEQLMEKFKPSKERDLEKFKSEILWIQFSSLLLLSLYLTNDNWKFIEIHLEFFLYQNVSIIWELSWRVGRKWLESRLKLVHP